MTLNVIVYTSSNQKISNLNLLERPVLKQLQEFAQLLIIPANKISDVDRNHLSLLLVLNKENTLLLKRQYEDLPRPILFLIDEESHNLPMVLEASTWLNSNSIKNEILCSDNNHIKKRIQQLERILTTEKRLMNRRIGILESPASNLIASNVDYFLTKRRWGVDFIDIPLNTNLSPLYTEDFKRIKQEIPDNVDFFTPFFHLIRSKRLSALALDLLKTPNKLIPSIISACSRLSKSHFPIAYQTDPQSIFTMLATKLLIGSTPTLSLPIQMDLSNNFIKLVTYPGDYNNFHDLKPEDKITILKCGNYCLDQFYLSSGIVLSNPQITSNESGIITIQLDTPVEKLLKKPLGSHYVLLKGEYNELIHEFFISNHCIRI